MKTLGGIVKVFGSHLELVSPGMPAAFTTACTAGDCIVQGDLYMTIVGKVPESHKKAKRPHVQLVPESGAGSHHRLESLNGVGLYYPEGWDVATPTDDLVGPCIVVSKEVRVVHEPGHSHPHGPVTIPAGLIVLCTYQREWVAEQRKARRVQD